MSHARNLRRRERQKPSPSAALAALLPLAESLQKSAEGVQEVAKVGALTAELHEAIEDARRVVYEVERQRWVSLRLIATINPVETPDAASVLAVEERYRAEYDGLVLLQATLTLLSLP
jgi:hypothetical protein